MKSKLGGRSAVGVIVVAGTLLSAAWTMAQSISPVPFEALSPAKAGVIDDDGLILDAYIASVLGPVAGTDQVTASTTEIVSRCGDGDGCRVRLSASGPFVVAPGTSLANKLKAGLFSVSVTGASWSSFSYDGAFLGSGFTSDGTTKAILEAPPTSEGFCTFLDSASAQGYVLSAGNDVPDNAFVCVLRIDD